MKKFLILALSAALLLALFGCGSPKEDDKEDEKNQGLPPGVDLSEFTPVTLKFADGTSKPKTETGENKSLLYAITGEDFDQIKDAPEGSILGVTYKAVYDYACGEVGWKSITDAGPVLMGDGTSRNREGLILIEDLVLGTDNLTIHIFNEASLRDVTLYIPPEKDPPYKPQPNENATEGAKKIVLPWGDKIPGAGDMSKVDFKNITTAASGNLVFYFDVVEEFKDQGILKFGPKCGDPYKHFGIDTDGSNKDESGKGWRPATDGKIIYTIAEVKAAVASAGNGFNKFEIRIGDSDGKPKADLLYIEIIP